MHIRIIKLYIDPNHLDTFREVTKKNFEASIKEEGVIRFDIMEDAERVGEYTILEVFKSSEDREKHFTTAHFKEWDKVAVPLFIAPLESRQYNSVFPDVESDWLGRYKS
ncbi:putative quinol monooxygenase [Sediminitomix flava]|uniref:Autoinducer 2-degrading protein n=1 Tax=Sediminitomix flava TaxID=379075 RepID=A0A315ZB16_SEDFL|nr:putative quinol monooxygenase [Sediminitomix flava]PWJ42349.1 autoinducer 2-degrading protein [Sediminitomix flava]